MDCRRPKVSPATVPAIPDEYYAIGARYADRRGRVGAMAGLGAEAMASLTSSVSSPVEVLYPGTSKLGGALLASLIRSPDLDSNYVQRFQNIAIIAQLADAILNVAQATKKCIVPVDFDSNGYTSPEGCLCGECEKEQQRKNESSGTEGKEKGMVDDNRNKCNGDGNVATRLEIVDQHKNATITTCQAKDATVAPGDKPAMPVPGSAACGGSIPRQPPASLSTPLQQMTLNGTPSEI